MKTLRLALAQINTTVGDFKVNAKKIVKYIKLAQSKSADIVAFPELCLTGYPPEDLLMKPQFISDNINVLNDIKQHVKGLVAIVGYVDRNDDIYNAAAIIYEKEIVSVYQKIYLPNYGVFDEMRYFQSGKDIPVYSIGGVSVGVSICEDIWYPEGPAYRQALSGAELIININASPYDLEKTHSRETMLSTRASDNKVVLAYLNTIGGQDELVFDGHSLVFDQDGNIIAKGKQFKEDLIVVDLDLDSVFIARLHDPRRRQELRSVGLEYVWRRQSDIIDMDVKRVVVHSKKPLAKKKIRKEKIKTMDKEEEIYNALILGTRDYVYKNNFRSVVIGLSGGIDSAFVLTVAVDAIGNKNVTALFMPSDFTSKESREDSYELSKNLKIKIIEISIEKILREYLKELSTVFKGKKEDNTEENLQARIRGNLLMAFSNKLGALVLTTGNKSEMSVGYATLYGDMAGGFALIKDVPKTMVYELALWRNKREGRILIPERILTKEPTAELRKDQKDTDTLPPYNLLDPIIQGYIEKDMNFEEILMLGCDEKCAKDIIKMIDMNEYKRRQAPPGIKITRRAFGKERRYPITNRYKSY